MKPFTIIRHATASLLLILSILPGQAAEQMDEKSWSGAVCRPYGSTPASNFFVRAESIQNISDSEWWVVCPILRDFEHENKESSFILNILGKRLPGQNVLCTVTTGSVPDALSNVTKSDSADSINWQLLFGISINSFSDHGQPITVKCRLPPNVQLGRLTLVEAGKTDTP